MNKKLMILIVALECVFSVFLISIFGPMVEAIHSGVPVSEISFLDENGERLPDGTVLEVDLENERSVSLSWLILPEDAKNKTVTVTADVGEDVVRITEDDPSWIAKLRSILQRASWICGQPWMEHRLTAMPSWS